MGETEEGRMKCGLWSAWFSQATFFLDTDGQLWGFGDINRVQDDYWRLPDSLTWWEDREQRVPVLLGRVDIPSHSHLIPCLREFILIDQDGQLQVPGSQTWEQWAENLGIHAPVSLFTQYGPWNAIQSGGVTGTNVIVIDDQNSVWEITRD